MCATGYQAAANLLTQVDFPRGGDSFTKVVSALAALIQAYGGRLAVSVWKV